MFSALGWSVVFGAGVIMHAVYSRSRKVTNDSWWYVSVFNVDIRTRME
jgi:hypothetical protein